MNRRKYVIFDLDGTLVDSYETVINACRHVFKEHAPETMPTDDYFASCKNDDMEHVFTSLAERSGMSKDNFRSEYDRLYAQDCLTGTTVIEQQYAMLADAKSKGYAVIVLTNKQQELAERVCNAMFTEGSIDAIIGRLDETPIKPRHIIIERLTEAGMGPPEQCVMYYGDSESDRQTANMLQTIYCDIKKK